MTLHIINSGLLATVQDYGRFGHQAIGVTTGGPMDEVAFLWGNRLLDNHYNQPQVEICYGNFSCQFSQPTTIAICGADLGMTLNHYAISPWSSYAVKEGDMLTASRPISGLYCYLAIQGGVKVKRQLSSCATVTRNGLGGLHHDGQPLATKDNLAYDACITHEYINRTVPAIYRKTYDKPPVLRYIPNSQLHAIGKKSQQTLSNNIYQVTHNISRMGYRLSGVQVEAVNHRIFSQGISLGTIQIPRDGQPIVLMRDKQTMGGYQIAGCVAYVDLPLLAQATPGTSVSFTPTHCAALEAEYLQLKNFFQLKC